jgi:phosphoribosyl 1,2-cyclic phosphodiesterase
MQLTVIGSGSSGNCYLLKSSTGETLIIEAGIRFLDIKYHLGFSLGGIVGCLITHEHGDHAKYAADYAKAGINIYASQGTLDAIGVDGHRAYPMDLMKWKTVGHFDVAAFDVEHDAAEPVGFLIEHKEMGKALFVTDTHYIKYTMRHLDHVLIEANFADWVLDENVERGSIHPKLAERIRSSHMSLGFVKEFIVANLLEPRNVVLLHLSDSNSDAAEFKQEIGNLVKGDVHIAEPELTVNLNKYPF